MSERIHVPRRLGQDLRISKHIISGDIFPHLWSSFKFLCDTCEISFVCMVSLIRQKGVDQEIGFDLFRPLLNDVCGMVGGALSMLENITEIMPGTTWVPKLRSSRDVLRKCKTILLASMHYALSPEEICNYRDWPKWWPWLPFSQARIVSDRIFGCHLLFSFTFNLNFGTTWKQTAAVVKLPKNQFQFKQAAERMWIKLRGPVDYTP